MEKKAKNKVKTRRSYAIAEECHRMLELMAVVDNTTIESILNQLIRDAFPSYQSKVEKMFKPSEKPEGI